MKKSFLLFPFLMLMASCNNSSSLDNQVQKSVNENKKNVHFQSKYPRIDRNDENILWAKFDSLSDNQKKELLGRKLERIQMRDSIAEAKRAEFANQFKNWDKMSIEEQRELLETRERTQAPLTPEQLAERNAKMDEMRKKHKGDHKHNEHDHKGHNHEGHNHDGHNHNRHNHYNFKSVKTNHSDSNETINE